MKICVAQIRPHKGSIEKNISNHKHFIQTAIGQRAGIIVFPELSLTGYEPALAKDLATTQSDKRFDIFQQMSDANNIIIGGGVPTREGTDLFISMIIFQPNKGRITYSKQYLFPGERGIFTEGRNSLVIHVDDENIIAPAICYELSNPQHAETAKRNNANIYMASVLNSVNGVAEDLGKLSAIARKYSMTVFMSNFVGQSGGYACAGKSSIWNDKGELIEQLDNLTEGIMVYDTKTKLAAKISLDSQ